MSSQRTKTLIVLCILVPIGFATKSYGGSGAFWVHNYLGGLLYEIFWCLLIGFLAPRVRFYLIATGVFLITSALECLQLWHPPFLETLRNTHIGHAILGSAFDPYDFPHYLIGCVIGYFFLQTFGTTEKGRII